MPTQNTSFDLIVDRDMRTGDVNLVGEAPAVIDIPTRIRPWAAARLALDADVVTFTLSNAIVRYQIIERGPKAMRGVLINDMAAFGVDSEVLG